MMEGGEQNPRPVDVGLVLRLEFLSWLEVGLSPGSVSIRLVKVVV